MNRTIISVEVQDHGGKKATILIRGERNNQILFEEEFAYKNEEKHPLRIHFLKEDFMNIPHELRGSMAVKSLHKLLNDITKRSEKTINCDYREKDNLEDCTPSIYAAIKSIFDYYGVTERKFRDNLYSKTNRFFPSRDKNVEAFVQRFFPKKENY